MMKIFIFSVAAAAILTAGVAVDTSTGGSSKKASTTQDATDKQTSKSRSASESSTKSSSKTKTSTSTKETANTKTTSTSSTNTKTSSASFSMGVKTPLTAIWQMPVDHMTFTQKNDNDAFNALAEKLSRIQSDGLIKLHDWENELKKVLMTEVYLGIGTLSDGQKYCMWSPFSYPASVASITIPYNYCKGVDARLSGTLTTFNESRRRDDAPYCKTTLTENGIGQAEHCSNFLDLKLGGDKDGSPKTSLLMRYRGYVNGSTTIKDGKLETLIMSNDGTKVEITTAPYHLLISKNGRTTKEFANDLIRDEKENVLVSLSIDNYSVIWNNNSVRDIYKKEIVSNENGNLDFKKVEGVENPYSYTNSPEYYCTLIENAKKIQREKGLSVSEIAMRLKEMMPKTNSEFATCQQQPKVGDVMFDRKANIVFNRSIEINAVSDETVSDAYASMFQDAKTEKFADAVQRAVAFLESKGRTTEANAMRSMAVKSTTSKSFDKVQEATFSAETVSEFFEALKK